MLRVVDLRKTLPATYQADSPQFRLELVASPDEVDELNHVSDLAYLRWVVRAARAHSDAVGYDYAAFQRLGAVLTVRRHEIDYLQPATAGDRVALTTWVESWRTTTQVRRTSIVRIDDGRELARALTQWGLIDAETGKPHKVPDAMRDSFRKPPR